MRATQRAHLRVERGVRRPSSLPQGSGVVGEQLLLAQKPAVAFLADRPVAAGLRGERGQILGERLVRGGRGRSGLRHLGAQLRRRSTSAGRSSRLYTTAARHWPERAADKKLAGELSVEVGAAFVEHAGHLIESRDRGAHELGLRMEATNEQREHTDETRGDIGIRIALPASPVTRDRRTFQIGRARGHGRCAGPS